MANDKTKRLPVPTASEPNPRVPDEPSESLGQWLIENMPRLGEIEVPPRRDERERPVPFADWTDKDWEAFDRKHALEDEGE